MGEIFGLFLWVLLCLPVCLYSGIIHCFVTDLIEKNCDYVNDALENQAINDLNSEAQCGPKKNQNMNSHFLTME